MIPDNYMEKLYAGWLGKLIGVRFGAPIEGWSYEQIEKPTARWGTTWWITGSSLPMTIATDLCFSCGRWRTTV